MIIRTFNGEGTIDIESSYLSGGGFALTSDLRAADASGSFKLNVNITDSILKSRRPGVASPPVRLRSGQYDFTARRSVFASRDVGPAFEVTDDEKILPNSLFRFDHCDFLSAGEQDALRLLGPETQVIIENSIIFAGSGRTGLLGNATSSLTSRHNGISAGTSHAGWGSETLDNETDFSPRAPAYFDAYGTDFRYPVPVPLLTASDTGGPVGTNRDFFALAGMGEWDSWLLSGSPTSAERVSWVEIDGEVYGAKPDSRGPIGGGAGYWDIITTGDFIVETDDELANALEVAQPGQVVFVPGDLEIDLTALIYVEDLVLRIPEGVTLASDRGHNGSKGALLTSDALDTPNMIRTTGPDVRVTGIRLQGPNPKQYLDHHYRAFRGGRVHEDDGGDPARRNHRYYYKFPTSMGIRTDFPRLQVDNCEIYGFGHAGVYLGDGVGHLVHHNYIHHCQYHGLGYGVSHNTSSSIIEYNHFNYNRHSIAGSGRPGSSYVARHNVELGISSEHCFDMHGGSSRGDGTDIAGATIDIHNNTFFTPITPAEYYADRPNAHAVINIRGTPEEEAIVTRNWMPLHSDPATTIFFHENTLVHDNAYEDPPVVK